MYLLPENTFMHLSVCYPNFKILSVNPRLSGSVHDSAVYLISEIKQILHHRYETGDRSSWLLEDLLEPDFLIPKYSRS